MRRCFVAFIAVLLLSGMLSACTPNRPAETEQNPENSVPRLDAGMFEDQSFHYFQENPVNDGEPLTLTMWVNEDWLDSYTFLMEQYKIYRPNVTVELISFPWKTYWTKLRLALQNGTGPDVFHMHNGFLSDFAPYLSPLPSELFGDEILSSSFRGTNSVQEDGEHYCINLGSSTGGIFYNREMWRRAGLTDEDIPKTWAQLRELALRLTQYDAAGNIVVDGFNFNGEAQSLLFAMQAQRGEPTFLENGQANLCTTQNIENVYFLRQLCNEDRVCRVNEAPSNELFGKGKAAMIYGWSWVANDLALNYPSVDYGFFCPPAWTEDVPSAYDSNNFETSFSINVTMEEAKRRAAEDLLLFYLCNDEVLVRTAKQAQIVPSKISLMESQGRELGEVISAQSSYIERTAFKGVVPDALYAYLTPMMNTDLLEPSFGIQELLRTADEECTRILRAYGFFSALPEYRYYSEFSSLF